MKMHEREWYAVLCKPRREDDQSDEPFQLIHQLTDGLKVKWKTVQGNDQPSGLQPFEFISSRRYFLLGGADSDLETLLSEEDSPRLIRKGNQVRFGYRGYAAIAGNNGLGSVTLVLLPYAGLAREFWIENIAQQHTSEVSYMRCDIAGLQKLMQRRSERTANLRLRLGRLLIPDDANARTITIRGQSILDSTLYLTLFDKSKTKLNVAFDDSYVRIAYYPTDGVATAIHIDRFGNYRARPGRNGWKAGILISFFSMMFKLGFLNETHSCPVSRLSTEDETQQ